MTRDEYEARWLEALREDADDTVDLLSSERQGETERRTCAAFLRCAGIEFEPAQLISSKTEPPDVLFGLARFEIALVLPTRKMHEEWKAIARRRREAKTISDLLEPYRAPETLTRQQVIDLVMPMADKKARRYCARGVSCADLDLLLYVNQSVVMDVNSPGPSYDLLVQQGWRSLSILIPPHSYVVFAGDKAPACIFGHVAKPTAAWTAHGLAGLFDI